MSSIDTEATALQRQGELGIWVPLLGQEARAGRVGPCPHADDYVFTSYREHRVAFCRGVDTADLPLLWRGAAHSGWDPDKFKTGYALGAHMDGAEMADVVYFGDGATSQGDIAEALGFARSWTAPIQPVGDQ